MCVLKIMGGYDTCRIGIIDNTHQALALPELEQVVSGQLPVCLVAGKGQPGQVCHRQVLSSPNSNGLKILGPQYGTHASAAGIAAPISGDTCHPGQFLARRTNGGYLHGLIPNILTQHVLGLYTTHT